MSRERRTRRGEPRQKIIAAAFESFARGGFHGSSIQEISDAVGMSKAGLLHHFRSKEALLLAVLAMREEMNQPPLGTHGLDMLVHLRNLAMVDSATRGTVTLFVIMGAEATSPTHPAHDFFVDRYVRTVSMIATCLDEAKDEGQLKHDLDAVQAARLMVSVMDGLQLQMLLEPSVDRVAALDAYIDQFLATNAGPNLVGVRNRIFLPPAVS